MLQLTNLSKSYGAETILQDISFTVSPGERVGVVGVNGCGKSTLMRIVAGIESYDSGALSVAAGTRTGYLPQGLLLEDSLSARAVIRRGVPGWDEARREVDRLAEALSTAGEDDLDRAMQAYSRAAAQFESLGGYNLEHQVEKIAHGLGLAEPELERPVSELSGGQRTRAGLARVLLASPDLLLLDEPTNHLDIEALEWLEAFLDSFTGAVLLVSHDRVFLDRTVQKVIALDSETHTAREYAGNYSDYVDAAARELAKTRQQWQDQQAEIRRLEDDIHRTKMHAQSVERTTTSRQPNVRRYAKKVAKKALSREKKLERYLESDERVEKPKKGWQMKLEFDESMRTGQIVLTAEEISFFYEPGQPVLEDFSLQVGYGDRIALLGRNGSGKSTLLKLIVGELVPQEGILRFGSRVKIGYMAQEQKTLPPEATPLGIIQRASPTSETDARNFLHYFLFEGDQALLPVGRLSYGERARLILAKLVAEGANFLVLDEPVNHLDIPSRERFEAALQAFPGAVLAAVHDRAFVQNFANRVVDLAKV